jgi:hypothetical protein
MTAFAATTAAWTKLDSLKADWQQALQNGNTTLTATLAAQIQAEIDKDQSS